MTNQKPFTINIDLERLIEDGKASIEPQDKVDAFRKRLSDAMMPVYRENKKKMHDSYQKAAQTYLTD